MDTGSGLPAATSEAMAAKTDQNSIPGILIQSKLGLSRSKFYDVHRLTIDISV
jgi:hypothetical protein